MRLQGQQVKGLLAALRETRSDEMDCEEFLEAVPELVEAGPGAAAASVRLAKAAAHERLCANCREEAEALRAMLAAR